METLKEFLAPKTFNRISYVAVIFWILFGVTLFGIFAKMESSDFRCAAESDKMDLVLGQCSEQYEKQYNKYGFPVYGFVIVNFFGIGFVCVIYSQVVKSKVDQQLTANRRTDVERQNNENPPTGRGLFMAYFCQLVTRLTLGIVFIVLQTQLFYPANFPSDFHCQISGGSEAANAESAGNTTMYECLNQQATKKTFWAKAVSVLNGVFAFLILIEIICILSRARKGMRFLEDSQFVKDHLPDHAPLLSSEPQQGRPLSEMQETEPQHVSEFIESLKKSVVESTEKPAALKALFKNKHGEGKRNEDRKIDNVYTKLVLIPNRARYDFTGNRQKQLKEFPRPMENFHPISREDIVDVENKKILIVGRPGIGKTLFLTKWVRDWALGKAFNHFEVAFFLKFRKFNSVEELSLRDLLSRSEYSQTLSDEVWNHVLTNPERVLIFFDGLDEFLNRSSVANERSKCNSEENPMLPSALFYNVVEGNFLPRATVLTTTRPTAVSDVTDLSFSKTFEILGFASEQVEEYVKNFAIDAGEDVADAGKKIWEHIKTNMNIFSLCYIPVNCMIICSCLLQVLKFHSEKGLSGVLPTKLTEVYQRALKLFFFRHNEQYRDEPLSREDIKSKDLPPEVEEKFKPLTKLAFDGLTQNRLIFGQKEVPEDLVNSALFHRLPDRKTDPFTDEAQYCFIHLTMQEYLAAKHIADTMKGEKLRRFVANHINKGEWQLVFQFLAGLLGEQSIDIFTDLLPETTEKNESLLMLDDSLEGRTVTCWPTKSEKHLAVTVMKCIDEANESGSVVGSKLEEIGFNAVDFSGCSLAPADCTAVAHFLKSCTQISLIDLSANNIGSLGCVEIVKLFDNTYSELTSLNLRWNHITDEGVKLLSDAFVNNNKLRSLNLSRNNITDKGVKLLNDAFVNNDELRSLNLAYNKITDKGVKLLTDRFINNNKLRSLILAYNKITDEGMKLLSDALVNNNKLRSLNLYGNVEITNEAINQIKQANPNCEVII